MAARIPLHCIVVGERFGEAETHGRMCAAPAGVPLASFKNPSGRRGSFGTAASAGAARLADNATNCLYNHRLQLTI